MATITSDAFNRLSEAQLPLAYQLGFRAETISNGAATARMPFDETTLRPGGTISGPAMMGLADFTMYAALMGAIGPVEQAVTTNLNINFLRRPGQTDVIADCRVLKLGKRLAVLEVTLFSEGEDEPIAHVTGTYSIPPNNSDSERA
ncbi:MAG: PaaI family thioesterase [Alphaproteobacteria bacterium]|nr:PaaI family thioesterase [Alphaproteobacteria bacterium]MCZ6587620.1 PaaI family thioesterase [Alphaproteobacteria bacterium]MCZ6590522.1 PaaI family thioesterase [Alphaproteobacteria bacterium]